MTPILVISVFAAGLIAGAIAAWFALREKLRSERDQGRNETATTLAVANERIRSLEEEHQNIQITLTESKASTTHWRDQYDQASNEIATLAERTLKIPTLESQLLSLSQERSETADALATAREQTSRLVAEASAQLQRLNEVRAEVEEHSRRRELAEGLVSTLKIEKAELESRLDAERKTSTARLDELANAREVLTNQFKALASDILEDKSKRFTEQNQTALSQLLDPLKLKIAEFQTKVETVYDVEGKDRSALAEQVRQLMALNKTISEQADNLTTALKGSNKTQGGWGEWILEQLLTSSGLTKGQGYVVQDTHQREDGSRGQPDVVIHLPNDRHLVVDAKVSLVAYENSVVFTEESERTDAVKRHLDSVRTHIRGLADKNYQKLYGLNSIDFVIMFIPIEPAFMVAVTNDRALFNDAWERNVLLVSPSTLLFVIRTVAHLWRQEAQNRNAQDIARRGAELYDKLVGFVESLQQVGAKLGQARDQYDTAMSRLHTGKGNVIRQAEMLKSLGIKATKNLPESVLEKALIEVEIQPQDDSVVSIASTPDALLDVSTGEHATDG